MFYIIILEKKHIFIAIPDLIHIIHCCPHSLKRIQSEFLHHWSGDGRKAVDVGEHCRKVDDVIRRIISRPQLKAKIMELAQFSICAKRWSLRDNFAKLDTVLDQWVIFDPSLREKYRLEVLPNSHGWVWATVYPADGSSSTPGKGVTPTTSQSLTLSVQEKTPVGGGDARVEVEKHREGKKLDMNQNSGQKSEDMEGIEIL